MDETQMTLYRESLRSVHRKEVRRLLRESTGSLVAEVPIEPFVYLVVSQLQM